ncbi:MAG: hypothetical protein OJF49_000993 [Ktedonobacterales bacterium]|nr:MAG: hypothetical protein OJF49_000993 [Ktedonobacterales bacterium]
MYASIAGLVSPSSHLYCIANSAFWRGWRRAAVDSAQWSRLYCRHDAHTSCANRPLWVLSARPLPGWADGVAARALGVAVHPPHNPSKGSRSSNASAFLLPARPGVCRTPLRHR